MWARFVNIALGIWLMTAPAILSYSTEARTNHLVVGPIVTTFAVIGMWEVVREVRWINLVLGVWLVVSAFLLSDSSALINGAVTGLLIAVLSLVKGEITQQFGGGWKALFRRSEEQDPG